MTRSLKDKFFKSRVDTIGNLVFTVLLVVIVTGGVIKLIDGVYKLITSKTVSPPTPILPKSCPDGQKLDNNNECQCEGTHQVKDLNDECVCMDGYEKVGGKCVPVCGDNSTRGEDGVCVCNNGFEYVGEGCVPVCGDNSTRGEDGVCVCNNGFEDVGEGCVPVCGNNSTRGEDGVCICNNGFEDVGEGCVPVCGNNSTRGEDGVCVCNSGYIDENGECVKEPIKMDSKINLKKNLMILVSILVIGGLIFAVFVYFFPSNKKTNVSQSEYSNRTSAFFDLSDPDYNWLNSPVLPSN